ncbi:MFS transporter [Streptomyces sp. NPDC053755]|uniref:MFS transporter n=1 Tax=Streptomyces sp. NPDC053755 TaxID=3155815 RepID=UPI003438A52B
MLRLYRDTLSVLGPALPAVSFLGRLPTAMCQLGSLLLVAETSGSLTTAGLAGGALAAGQTVAGPVVGRLADRRGQRGVVLTASLANAVLVTALVAAALAQAATGWLMLLGALAGASVPQVGPLARTRSVALVRRGGADDRGVATVLSFEGTLDEVSFVLGPALVGVAAALAHPAAALLLAAALLATCGTAFALHPSARAAAAPERRSARSPESGSVAAPGRPPVGAPGSRTLEVPESGAVEVQEARAVEVPESGSVGAGAATAPAGRGVGAGREAGAGAGGVPGADGPALDGPAAGRAASRTTRTGVARRGRLSGAAYALRVTMALQGAMFGASQAGITALTEKLGAPEQAGLVYAAMGVMSAAVGLSMAAVPAGIGPAVRWRVSTAALVVLSVPLVVVDSLGALYAVVIVLGAAFAPHLITVFALTERTVPAARLAESMAFLTSGIVGGQALALAVSGGLADGHGAPAAFAVGVAAAVLCAVLSWAVRIRLPSARADA